MPASFPTFVNWEEEEERKDDEEVGDAVDAVEGGWSSDMEV